MHACSFMEKSIKSVETSLSNQFNSLAKDLTTEVLEVDQEMSGEEGINAYSVNGIVPASCDVTPNLSVKFSSILPEEREKDKRKLKPNFTQHN